MTLIFNDAFEGSADGANLNTRPGWTKHTSSAVDLVIIGGRAVANAAGTGLYYAAATPASAEYDVEGVVRAVSLVGATGLAARMDPAANTMYRVRLALDGSGTINALSLDKFVAGVQTNLGLFNMTFVAGTDYAVKLEIRDAAKKVFIDGVERLSSADNAITAAGKAGIRTATAAGTATTGPHLDNFKVTDLLAEGWGALV